VVNADVSKLRVKQKSQERNPQGTRTVQADSGSDSDSESQRQSPRRLPAGWDRSEEPDYTGQQIFTDVKLLR